MTIMMTNNDTLTSLVVELRQEPRRTEPCGLEGAQNQSDSSDPMEFAIELDFDGFAGEDSFSAD